MFNTLDWIIVGLYCIGIISLATMFQEHPQVKKGLQKIIF